MLKAFRSYGVLLLALLSAGCAKYDSDENQAAGVFYPAGCISTWGYDDGYWHQYIDIKFCQPVNIVGSGTIVPSAPLSNAADEVFKLKLSDGDVFILKTNLAAFGTIKYEEKRQPDSFQGVADFFNSAGSFLSGVVKLLIGVAIIGFFASFFGGGGTWSGGGSLGGGGTWSGSGTYSQ